jgi:hypothetical protein
MSTIEITLKRTALNNFDNWFGDGLALCDRELRKHVDIPSGVRQIVVVFSKRRLADSFKLTGVLFRPIAGLPRTDFFCCARRTAREAYRAGYRYVRVEYENERS